MNYAKDQFRAGAHGLASGVFNALDGGSFGSGSFAQGVNINPGLMVLSTSSIGGFVAWVTGGDFVAWALQGLQIGMFNHVMHGDGIRHYTPNGNYYTIDDDGVGEVYVVGHTLTDWSLILSAGSLVPALVASRTYYEDPISHYGWWKDRKGTFHSLSEVDVQSNGKYLRGVQGKRISLKRAMKTVKVPSAIAKALGILSVANEGYDFSKNPSVSEGLNLIRSIAGYRYLPYAAADLYISISWEYIRQTQEFNLKNDLPLNYGIFNTTSSQYW